MHSAKPTRIEHYCIIGHSPNDNLGSTSLKYNMAYV